jgi:hypothetical protein
MQMKLTVVDKSLVSGYFSRRHDGQKEGGKDFPRFSATASEGPGVMAGSEPSARPDKRVICLCSCHMQR